MLFATSTVNSIFFRYQNGLPKKRNPRKPVKFHLFRHFIILFANEKYSQSSM